jgi:hypothetical protein
MELYSVAKGIQYLDVIKTDEGSFYIDKISEAELNSFGYYKVDKVRIEKKVNYYTYSKSAELIDNVYTISYIPTTKALQDAIDYKLSLLADKATEVEEQGITVSGLEIATDVKSQSKLTTAITFFGRKPNEVRKFKTKNGFASADKATVEAIQDALDIHLVAVTANEELHYNAINLLESVAEIEAYDIATGW